MPRALARPRFRSYVSSYVRSTQHNVPNTDPPLCLPNIRPDSRDTPPWQRPSPRRLASHSWSWSNSPPTRLHTRRLSCAPSGSSVICPSRRVHSLLVPVSADTDSSNVGIEQLTHGSHVDLISWRVRRFRSWKPTNSGFSYSMPLRSSQCPVLRWASSKPPLTRDFVVRPELDLPR